MARLVPAQETAADWIVAALRTFGISVLSIVPEGFPSYVRVFHPAYRLDPNTPEPSETRRPVRWAEVADANGTRFHPGSQWPALTGSYSSVNQSQPGVFDDPPIVGSLPTETAELLAAILRRHTAAPERCWFAVWNGFGATRDLVRESPTFRVPGREYHVLAGEIEAILDNVLNRPFVQSANLWWPDDRAWCVATEIDLNTTYLGCSETCRDDLLAARDLEGLEIDPTTGISWLSDTINPAPPEPH
jgi:hypothetical protein